MMIKTKIFFLLFITPFYSFASGAFTTSVTSIGVNMANEYVYVNINPPENQSTCSSHSQVRFNLDSEVSKGALSIALASKLANKKIKMYFVDGNCMGAIPIPTTLELVE